MIVYRPQQHVACTAEAFGAVWRDLREIEALVMPSVEHAQDLLIRFGAFEAAVADALSPERDEDSAEARALRRASVALGRLFCRALRREPCGRLIRECSRAFAALSALSLPPQVIASVPEGYAYYGLFPQTYVTAAEQCLRELRPSEVVVIGIRGIGASLASAVAGCLEEHDCHVRSYTVRPHGHPFDREVGIGDHLRAEWGDAQSAVFAVVDEGPGLSGSSFASVTKLLASIGIREDRIVLFPSWSANPAAFVNESARSQWERHRRFVAGETAPRPEGRDVSAGAWRPLLFTTETAYPAVQPQHERRKYLTDSGVLNKFAGIGRYGSQKLSIAECLAEEGFTPAPTGFSNGFLGRRFAPGRPLFVRDVSSALLDRIASYLAFRKAKLPAERSVDFDSMLELIRINSQEGIGPDFAVSDKALAAFRSEFEDRAATAVDGRMLPHEWLATRGGFIKTDDTDHHADHFFPGGADIAWDLAAAGVEFQLRRAEREYLMTRYIQFSGDRPSRGLAWFYRIAYLAFRLGYSALAAGPTAGTAEYDRFQSLQLGYGSVLQRELSSYIRNAQVTA